MVKTRALQVRGTRLQHERIRAAAEQKGFPSVAAYLRYVALENHGVLQEKLLDIHRHLTGEEAPRGRRPQRV